MSEYNPSMSERRMEKCRTYIGVLENRGTDPVMIEALRSMLRTITSLRGVLKSVMAENNVLRGSP